MGLTSHLSDAYDAFSSLCASFTLLLSPMKMTLTNQMTTVQGPGYFPFFTFCYVLKYPLINSFDCCPVESYLVESQYFQYFSPTFPAQKLFQFQFPNSSYDCGKLFFAYSFNTMRMRHPIVPVRAPPDPVRVLYSGSDDIIKQVPYIVCIIVRVPKMYELWALGAQGVREFRPFA